ncbi:MAG: hypothetical protein WAU39_18210 [Polyangiales bacterium]
MSTYTPVLRSAAAYFGIVFAAGFALGTLRTLFLAPRFGELWAVLLELPIMLAISWWACGKVVTRFRVPPRIAPRAAIGVIAFALLMLAEIVLSLGLFARSMSDYAADLTTPHGLVGLGGQVAFALMPLVRR